MNPQAEQLLRQSGFTPEFSGAHPDPEEQFSGMLATEAGARDPGAARIAQYLDANGDKKGLNRTLVLMNIDLYVKDPITAHILKERVLRLTEDKLKLPVIVPPFLAEEINRLRGFA